MTPDSWIGRTLDQYRLDAVLGQGALGVTYRAYDMRLERSVALKIIRPELTAQVGFRPRYLSAVRAAAQLDHPAITTLYDYAIRPEQCYLVMELIRGGNLAECLGRARASNQAIDLRDALVIGAQTAEGLAHAHAAGVCHGNLNPRAVMLKRLTLPENPGEPPLRAVLTGVGLTLPGVAEQAPAYLAPEQATGGDGAVRADLYALGALVYELTVGRPPDKPVTAPRALLPGLPIALEQSLLKALAPNPTARWLDADSMAQQLRVASLQLSPQQATTYAAPQTTISLADLLADTSSLAPISNGGVSADSPPQLLVLRDGALVQAHTLNKLAFTIGRSSDNDIALSGNAISRQHALLERTEVGWRVTDLNSTNGTFVGEYRLRPHTAWAWAAEQPLRLGEYQLLWQPLPDISGGRTPERVVLETDETPAAPHLHLTLVPATIELAPGRRAQAGLEIGNADDSEVTLTVAVEGLSAEWVTLPQASLTVPAGGQIDLPINLQLPRNSQAAPGARPYRINVTSQTQPGGRVSVDGSVVIQNVEAFDLDVEPLSVSNRGVATVTITNRGNVRATCTITGANPHEAIHFTGLGQQITLEPGQQGVVEVEMEAIRRRIVGRTHILPFDLIVFTAAGVSRQQAGELEVRPLIPTWLVLLGLLVFFALLALYLFDWFGPDLFNQAPAWQRLGLILSGSDAGRLV